MQPKTIKVKTMVVTTLQVTKFPFLLSTRIKSRFPLTYLSILQLDIPKIVFETLDVLPTAKKTGTLH